MPRLPVGLRWSLPSPQVCACAATLWLAAAPVARAQTPPPNLASAQAGSLSPASLAGEIVTSQGAHVGGAAILLEPQSGSATPTERTTSGLNGDFLFPALPAGAYTLTVTLPGFTPAHRQLTLAPGQTLQLPPLALTLATVSITVDALTPAQAAAPELHAEEHQRLAGVLPNFFVSYNWTAPPLTTRQKYTLATRNAADPGNLALVGVTAGVQQAANAFPGYGQGAAGYGRRFGADLGNLVAGTYLGGAVLPSLFHQDPRYFYKGTGTKRARFFYAISRAVVTRGDNGHTEPNFAGVLGDLSASALSETYYPASDRQGATLFLENGILAIAGDAMNGLVQEFLLPRFTTRGKKTPPPPTPQP